MEHNIPGRTVRIRTAQAEDYPFILRLNEENVAVLSPMDETRLRALAGAAELFLVAEADGRPAAFLIAIREGVTFYDSENYRWFSRNYPSFLYIDRVVIAEGSRGLGLGRLLYQQVFDHARSSGAPCVTAEIDTEPYNEASLKFHAAMGFHEVGVQRIRGGCVQVSLQEAPVPPR